MSKSKKKKKERLKQQRSCRNKRKYTKEQAYAAARNKQKQGYYLKAYQCPICNGWHIGKPFQQVRTKMAFDRLHKIEIKLTYK